MFKGISSRLRFLPALFAFLATSTSLGPRASANEVKGPGKETFSQQQVGENDFRISSMGPDGDAAFDGFAAAVAFNSIDNEFLVVWYGEDQIQYEYEIYARRVDAVTGRLLGNRIQVTQTGPEDGLEYLSAFPRIVHNPKANEYLVV